MQIIRFGIVRQPVSPNSEPSDSPSSSSQQEGDKVLKLDDYRALQKFPNPPWLLKHLRERRKYLMASGVTYADKTLQDDCLETMAEFFAVLRSQGGTFATSKEKIMLVGRQAHVVLPIRQLKASSPDNQRWLLEQLGVS